MTSNDEPSGEPEIARRLQADRPLPSAGFRGVLSRHLLDADPGYGTRPEHLRATVVAYVLAGALVLLIALLQATGSL